MRLKKDLKRGMLLEKGVGKLGELRHFFLTNFKDKDIGGMRIVRHSSTGGSGNKIAYIFMLLIMRDIRCSENR